MTIEYKTDFIIVGGGMVGLSVAKQLIKRKISNNIIILDKENSLGLHSSGRNSGVLHAGLYYEPKTLKARVCINGAKRLSKWAIKKGLTVNRCGKIIVAQKEELDKQLDLIYDRGKKNGAEVYLIDDKKLNELLPFAKSASGRAIWSPNTAVVDPAQILNCLYQDLKEKGVVFLLGEDSWFLNKEKKQLKLKNRDTLIYKHLINCAGLYADKIAKKFQIGENYRMIPFKGLYWQLNVNSKIKPQRNLYPVPDLDMPFLGVHFTPGINKDKPITIGPTATLALGRENYDSLESIEPLNTLQNVYTLGRQFLENRSGIRNYVANQSLTFLKPFVMNSIKELIPALNSSDIQPSKKVGIRAQLFDQINKKLVKDLLILHGPNSTHVINAISPAFTSSFEFADLIISEILKRGYEKKS